MSSLKRDDEISWVGAACAVVGGSLVAFVGRFEGLTGELMSQSIFVALGLVFAAIGGGVLARRVVDARLFEAIWYALALGLMVPIATGGVAVPLIGVIGAPGAWPATIPAALIWMIALRSLAHRGLRRDRVARAGLAVVLSLTLLAVRFTQPISSKAQSGAQCVSFPTEHIASIAWSPDGDWLGIGSRLSNGDGIVRVLDRPSNKVFELARASGIDVDVAGLAVGPGGVTAYLQESWDDDLFEPGPTQNSVSLMVAEPTDPPRRYAELPGPAIADLTYTEAGIAGVQWVDLSTGEVDTDTLVWIAEGARADDALRKITPEEAAKYPILAPLGQPGRDAITITTPSGVRQVPRTDAYEGLSATRDGRAILYVNSYVDDDDVRTEVVKLSTETGERQVISVAEDARDPVLEGGWLAYRTVMSSTNRACVMSFPVAE